MKKPTIKVTCNLYGNWNGYLGAARVRDFGTSEFDATDWLSEQLKTGEYTLSSKSTLTVQDIEKHHQTNAIYEENSRRMFANKVAAEPAPARYRLIIEDSE